MIHPEPVDSDQAARYVRGLVLPVAPIVGTLEWILLDDTDPLKVAALITGGLRWCLETELAQRDYRELALKEAARDLGRELDWSRVARRLRERDDFYRRNPDLRRKVVA